MEKLIQQLKEKYHSSIALIEKVGAAEIDITLNSDIDADEFSQNLQDHLLEVLDELTIVKFNIENANGEVVRSFATNQ